MTYKCEFIDKGNCILTNKTCRKTNENSIKNCKYLNRVKEDAPSQNIYNVREDITCIKCGGHTAYQYVGKLYPSGLPKEKILRFPPYGKYYDKTYLSPAVGFGGTIPYKCGSCGEVGLIDCCLEGYEAIFTAKKED